MVTNEQSKIYQDTLDRMKAQELSSFMGQPMPFGSVALPQFFASSSLFGVDSGRGRRTLSGEPITDMVEERNKAFLFSGEELFQSDLDVMLAVTALSRGEFLCDHTLSKAAALALLREPLTDGNLAELTETLKRLHEARFFGSGIAEHEAVHLLETLEINDHDDAFRVCFDPRLSIIYGRPMEQPNSGGSGKSDRN